mgnify:CR=1 FL=1
MIVPMMMKVDFASITLRRGTPDRTRHYAVRQLGGQTVFDGVLRVAVLPRRFCLVDRRPNPISTSLGRSSWPQPPAQRWCFVWSYLTDGDPAYTLVQVYVNNLIMLVLFVPIVGLLVSGTFVVCPFPLRLAVFAPGLHRDSAGDWLGLRAWRLRQQGQRCVKDMLLPPFAPVTIAALLLTLVFILAFQAQNIMGKTVHVGVDCGAHPAPGLCECRFGLWAHASVSCPHAIAAPGALIGSQQLFRIGSGNGHCSVRCRIRSGVGNG